MSEVPARFQLSSTPSPQSRQGCGCGWLIIFIVIAAIGYSAARYFIDQSNFNAGHQAYQQADCATAMRHFDTVINGWRPVDVGDYLVLAQQKRKECNFFQGAIDEQQAGNLSAALVIYTNFIDNYSESVLVETARNRIASLFEQADPPMLATDVSCQQIDSLLEQDLIPQRDVYLPPLYLACGQVYDAKNDYTRAFDMYNAFLVKYPEDPRATAAEAALLANPTSCEKYSTFLNTVIAERADFMPALYYRCGQAYDANHEYGRAVDMHKAFLVEYPNDARAAEVATALLANPAACERYSSFVNTVIVERTDFMPSLYYGCGQKYEGAGRWANALTMYENFLAAYPNHALATDVKTALARAILAVAKEPGAGELPPPQPIGSTGTSLTEVVIRNDSPERLRIVFSGSEVRVEEVAACDSCRTYSFIGPSSCPEQGTIGRFTLQPGQYEVVVKSFSDTNVRPWLGQWNLVSGDEYHSCFFIVTTFGP